MKVVQTAISDVLEPRAGNVATAVSAVDITTALRLIHPHIIAWSRTVSVPTVANNKLGQVKNTAHLALPRQAAREGRRAAFPMLGNLMAYGEMGRNDAKRFT